MPLRKGGRVYIAGPLTSSGDPQENIANACHAFQELMQLGLVPFLPHLSWYVEQHFGFNLWTTVEWLRYDAQWLKLCDAVLRLPGFSRGADIEETIAMLIGIPIFYSLEDIKSAMEG